MDDVPEPFVVEQFLASESVARREKRNTVGLRTDAHDLGPRHTDPRRRQVRNVHFRVVDHLFALEERRDGRHVVPAVHERLQHGVHHVPVALGRERHQRQYLRATRHVAMPAQRQERAARHPPTAPAVHHPSSRIAI